MTPAELKPILNPGPSGTGNLTHANDQYVLRLPAQSHGNFRAVTAVWNDQSSELAVQPPIPYKFIEDVDWLEFAKATSRPMHDWDYDYRWTAQSILPFLYLGPNSICKNMAFLRDRRISMVLSIRQGNRLLPRPLAGILQKTQDSGINVQVLDVASSQELTAGMGDAIFAINKHLSAPEAYATSVLVCCESGSTRSAAVVVAYCMQALGLSLEVALRVVHSGRFCVSFEESLKSSLSSYAEIVQAQRDVNRQSSSAPGTFATKRARTADDNEDEDDMGYKDDLARFGHRRFEPFSA